MTTEILRTLAGLRERTGNWRANNETIGLVPTMGALHPGHLSLVRAARNCCDRVIVTIFVNPKQFNRSEDLDKYPRSEEDDTRQLEALGVDVAYLPNLEEIYPPGFLTKVCVTGLTDMLCGRTRPGHFDGVATVVTKLFTQSQADQAFFGEKDYQQLQLVSRLAKDLDLALKVVGCPVIREEDGLAMSSRNRLLTTEDRARAAVLPEVMQDLAASLRAGARLSDIVEKGSVRLLSGGFNEIDYIELRYGNTLEAIDTATEPDTRLFIAAWLGGVRLIDNVVVTQE